MAFLGVDTSLSGRRWLGPGIEADRQSEAMAQQTGLPPPLCRTLVRRNVGPEEAQGFLDPRLRDLLPDPLTLRDMGKAATRFLRAVKTREKIAIFADYDVDGGSSAALLIVWLRALGIDPTLYIPDRIDEGYGPNGVAVIVEAMTDNRNRTASTVRSTFSKNGGNLGETGSVGFMFDRKGEIVYPATVADADTVMMAAIEAGAEDVQSDEDNHVIYCADTDLNEVSTALEAALGDSESTKLIWKPNMTTELDLEGLTKLMKLLDTLEEDDDIQRITSNFEASDEVMQAFAEL